MTKTPLILLAVSISLSCSSSAPQPDAETAAPAAEPVAAAPGTPDSKIGLAPGTAFEQPDQEPIAFNTVEPGESEPQARPSETFPPVIPHSVEDLEVITETDNGCMDCHGAAAAAYSDAPAIPPSHQVDLRRSPDTQGDRVVGARWICTSCHVAQTDAAPLVENISSS